MPMEKMPTGPAGSVEDMGPAVVSPDAPSDPGDAATKKAKKATPPGRPGGKGEPSEASPKAMGDGSGDMKVGAREEVEHLGGDEDDEEHEEIVAEASGGDEDEEEISIDERVSQMDLSDDVNALAEGSELSEEFKQKAAIIFEAAVKSKIRSELERLEEEYTAKFESVIEAEKDAMAEKVDGYLTFVVEEWMKKNEMAVEHKMKTEIAESFITGLKGLFEEHNIAVPDEQFDMLDAASKQVDDLESKLNESIEQNVALTKSVNELKRHEILLDVASDLADTEVEKFAELTENINYESEEDFREKVDTIKESYFPKVHTSSNNDDTAAPVDAEEVDVSDTMAAYMTAISRTNPAKISTSA